MKKAVDQKGPAPISSTNEKKWRPSPITNRLRASVSFAGPPAESRAAFFQCVVQIQM